MTAHNDITGDAIRSKAPTQAYQSGWDRTFGPKENKPDYTQIAKTCHEAVRALCQAFGDNSVKPWEEAEQWQIDSTFQQIQFAIENPNTPVSSTHDSWSAQKIADGWKYGPVKDGNLKEHPCLVPFEELPQFQQAKDYLFAAIVKSFT